MESLQQFSATERVEHAELDKNGQPHSAKTARFEYGAEIRDMPDAHVVSVQEYRNGSSGEDGFPTQLATRGLPAFALIFHPNYIGDFSMTCEGLAQIQGRAAWQVRFAQQRVNGFRKYRVKNVWHRVKLQGRAWIAVDEGYILRLDSELLEPIPEIQLNQEHIVIDYRAVEFPKQEVQLWLPELAEITINLHGRSYRQRHAFSDFQLFWVDTKEKRKEPQLPPEAELKQ